MTRAKVVAALVCLVAVVAAAPFAWGYVSKWLKVSLDAGENPYAGITIVHRQLPPSTVPDEWADRLEKQVGTDLGLEVRQDWRPDQGDGPWTGASVLRAALEGQVRVPEAPDFRVMGVLTNARDAKGVAEHGLIYLIWFQTPVDADSWIRSTAPVFTDPAAEKASRTWWAGFDAVHYTPGAQDHTDAIDHWVRSFTACPNGEQGCSIPEHLATAGVTPAP